LTVQEEYADWAKRVALEFVYRGEVVDAVASFVLSIGRQPNDRDITVPLAIIGMKKIIEGPEAVRQWIEGF
jgi:hypothetical protein